MEQTKAVNALEPFLALTKSASSPRAAADLITQATSAPNTYIFTTLLQAPQIQRLSESAEYAAHLRLLEIFSYGTYSDYVASAASLPALSAEQSHKLRQLSLLSLASDPTNLTYTNLLAHLSLPSNKALEDLVISAIYANLLTATLDPLHSTVLVNSVAPLRDVAPQSIPTMLATLAEWQDRCDSTLRDLERQIASIREEAAKRAKEEAEWASKVEDMIEKEAGKAKDTYTSDPRAAKGGNNLFTTGDAFNTGRKLGGGDGGKQSWGDLAGFMDRKKKGQDAFEDLMDVDDGGHTGGKGRKRGFGDK